MSSAAPVIQITAGVESSRFIDGLDISDGQAAVSIASEVSLDNGSFAGVDCYKSETLAFPNGIDAGCVFYVGYFAALTNQQAISATFSRGEYAPTPSPARDWDYSTATLSWHTNRTTVFTLSASDDWLGRGYGAIGLNAAYQYSISDRWSANIEASYTNFEAMAPIDAIEYLGLGVRFEQGRWGSELKLHLNDTDLEQLTPFEVDQPDVSLRFTYRLY